MRAALSLVLLGCVLRERLGLVRSNEMNDRNERDSSKEQPQNVGSDNSNAESDQVWKLFFGGSFENGYIDHSHLLEFYGCPHYDGNGIAQKGTTRTTCAVSAKPDAACEESTTTTTHEPYSTIPTEDTWRLFEEAFYWALELESNTTSSSTNGSNTAAASDSSSNNNPHRFPPLRGMKIPHEVRYQQGLGRTVHATEFVPKNSLIWTESHTAAFTTQINNANNDAANDDASIDASNKLSISTYRRFIEYLNKSYHHQSSSLSSAAATTDKRNNWACDALMWTWIVHEFRQDPLHGNRVGWETMHFCISFDMGNMFNDAKGDEALHNVGFIDDQDDESLQQIPVLPGRTRTDCQFVAMRALRDIQPGEELRYEYEEEIAIA